MTLIAEMTCPNKTKHTKSPVGYLEWHEWAAKKSRTHIQIRCVGCGLFMIWKPKPQKVAFASPEEEL